MAAVTVFAELAVMKSVWGVTGSPPELSVFPVAPAQSG
jgi:hypothetical protein